MGKGIPRRLIDLTDDVYDYSQSDIEKIFNKLKISANILKTRRVAFLITELPSEYDVRDLASVFKTDQFEAGIFTEMEEAVMFLNKAMVSA